MPFLSNHKLPRHNLYLPQRGRDGLSLLGYLKADDRYMGCSQLMRPNKTRWLIEHARTNELYLVGDSKPRRRIEETTKSSKKCEWGRSSPF